MKEKFFSKYILIFIIYQRILLFYRYLSLIRCVEREHLVRTSGRLGVNFMYIWCGDQEHFLYIYTQYICRSACFPTIFIHLDSCISKYLSIQILKYKEICVFGYWNTEVSEYTNLHIWEYINIIRYLCICEYL